MAPPVFASVAALGFASLFVLPGPARAQTDPPSDPAPQVTPFIPVAPPRERLLMDFNWRFHLGEAPDAMVRGSADTITSGVQATPFDTEGKGADAAAKMTALTNAPPDYVTKFEYPEPKNLEKTAPNEIGFAAKGDAQQADPVATNLGADISYVQPSFDDKDWSAVNLPHDWALDLPYDAASDDRHGCKPIGLAFPQNSIGWYRRHFALSAGDKNKTLWLEFDGVYRNSLVWLNGHCLGRRPSGYTSFYFDIGKYANFSGTNTLVVRVDARRAEGWFYEGAGIYRHVWLEKMLPAHVAHDGIFVYSQFKDNVPQGPANIHAEATLDSVQDVRAATVSFEILDASGQSLAKAHGSATTDAAAPLKADLALATPQLWSPETPNLYTLVTTVSQAGQVSDVVRTAFGVRTVAFDANRGCLLNGKPYFINGTCNHQDATGVGNAVPDTLFYDRVWRLREMGSNGYRTAHNPPAAELIDACDQLGMLVLDENRRMDSSPATLEDLKSMILRDRNHPSVFAWSLGNEEVIIQGTPAGGAVAAAMAKVVHDLDPTRSVTAAMNFKWGEGFTDALDVLGMNYTFNDPDAYHAQFPDKPIMNCETGSDYTSRGVYTGGRGKYSSSYDTNGTHAIFVPGVAKQKISTASEWQNYYAARPWMSSVFIWVGFDYRGEARWPNVIASMGAIDLCGFPKDLYYYFQSAWGKKPMIHLLPDWTSGAKVNKPIRVVCYTNCDEAELFLNGTSLGKQAVARNKSVEWQVTYAPGTLAAKGYMGGKDTVDTQVETVGAPVALKLIPDRTTLKADGRDVSLVTVEVVDDQGRMEPLADNDVHFEVKGGALLGVGNGQVDSHEMDTDTHRHLFSGLAQAVVQAPRQAGPVTLTADSPGLTRASITIPAQADDSQPIVP